MNNIDSNNTDKCLEGPCIINNATKNTFAVIEFLESKIETSMFLLGNISQHGFKLGVHSNSGNFKSIKRNGKVIGVFCLSRRGSLLIQTDNKNDYSKEIFDSTLQENISLKGILGNWKDSWLFYSFYKAMNPNFELNLCSEEILFSLKLEGQKLSRNLSESISIRFLTSEDYAVWDKVNRDYLEEEGLSIQKDNQEREVSFTEKTQKKEWWGLFEKGELTSICAYNSTYKNVGQIGGVYTVPAKRKKGYAKLCMKQLISDSYSIHKFSKLFLFTGKKNIAAQKLYKSLGFAEIGNFGILLGKHK